MNRGHLDTKYSWTGHFSKQLLQPPEVDDRIQLAENSNRTVIIERKLVPAFLGLIIERVPCEMKKNNKGQIKSTRVAVIIPGRAPRLLCDLIENIYQPSDSTKQPGSKTPPKT